MTKLVKAGSRPKPEIEVLKEGFPNFDDVPYRMLSTPSGEIIEIETNDAALILHLKTKGLVELP